MDEKAKARLEMQIIEQLKGVFDPEIPVNIYDLGLIYNIEILEDRINVDMTLTSPTCPVSDSIVAQVQYRIGLIPNAPKKIYVNLVWEPMWHKDMISDAGKLELGIFD